MKMTKEIYGITDEGKYSKDQTTVLKGEPGMVVAD